jgi:autotransporter-associated beta strand protein
MVPLRLDGWNTPVTQRRWKRLAGLICAGASLFVAGIEDAEAATRRWDGSSSALWSDAANWEENVAPVNGDDLVFPSGGANTVNQNDIVGLQVNSVVLEGNYTITGQPITLGAGGLAVNASSTVTWGLETILSAVQTWAIPVGSSSLIRSGRVDLNNQALTFDVAGSVSGPGDIIGTAPIVKAGVGSVTFSVPNHFGGIVHVNGGYLVVSDPTGLGVADFSLANGTVVDGGTLVLADSVALAAERLTLNGSGQSQGGALALAASPGNNASIASGQTITLASDVTMRVPAGQTLSIGTILGGAGGIGLDGDGTLALSNIILFTGDLTIGASGPSNGTIRAVSSLPHDIDVSLPYAGSTVEFVNNASGVFGSLTGAGKIVLNTQNSSVLVRQNVDTTYTGVISGPGSFGKTGSGRLVLTANHTVSGNANVNNGTLALIGGGLPSANVGTFLSATLSLMSNPQLGTLDLGTTSTLALDEGGPQTARSLDFRMLGSPTLRVGVSGQTDTCSQLRVTGTVILDGHLAITHVPGAAPDGGFTCTIIDNDGNDPVTGGFDGVGEGGLVSAGAVGFRVSYVGGDGNDVTLTDATRKYYLSEGATGSFFDLDILLANPNTEAVPVELTFLPEGGAAPHIETIELAPLSRRTVRVDDITALQNVGAVSTIVTSMNALPIMVERTMRWDNTGYGAHTDKASDGPALKWYFAEGSQGFFQTYLLLANPTTEQVGGEVEYLLDNAPPVKGGGGVDPMSRRTIWAGEPSLGLDGQSFGMVVTFDKPAIAERAMYFGNAFAGGHESAGINGLSTSWFLAEGATGPFFETFVLLANPNDAPAEVTLRFLPASVQPISVIKPLPGRSRLTVNIEAEHPLLSNVPVATQVTSTQPIVVERAQYWPDPASTWYEAHNSFGVTQLGTRWGLAEGRIGGPSNYQTYILLANPWTFAADVTIQFLRTSGPPIVKTFKVDPASRYNVSVGPGTLVPELTNEEFGAVITSTISLAVERALYSDAIGQVWAAGTNATAARLP